MMSRLKIKNRWGKDEEIPMTGVSFSLRSEYISKIYSQEFSMELISLEEVETLREIPMVELICDADQKSVLLRSL